jgi:hypothetical protein
MTQGVTGFALNRNMVDPGVPLIHYALARMSVGRFSRADADLQESSRERLR